MTTAWQQVPQQERQPGSDVPARSVPVSMSAPESGGEPELAAVLQQFPPVAHAFAYGSGVFRQPGLYPLGSGDRPMLDFIFAVDAPAQWHAQVRLRAIGYRGLQQHDPALELCWGWAQGRLDVRRTSR